MQSTFLSVLLLVTLVAYIKATPTSLGNATSGGATSSLIDASSSAPTSKMANLFARITLPFNLPQQMCFSGAGLWVIIAPWVLLFLLGLAGGAQHYWQRHQKTKKLLREEGDNY
jgi:hypothetical protein